jgi:O-antigen/teichoic acid export membrane protein
VASIVVARALGVEARGLLGVMAVIAELGVTVIGLGMPFAVTYYAARRRRFLPALAGNGLVAGGVVAVVALSLAVVTMSWLNRTFNAAEDERVWLLVGGLFPVYLLGWWYTNLVRAQQEFRALGLIMVTSRLVALGASLIFVPVLGLGVAGAVLALGAPRIWVALAAFPIAVRDGIRSSWLLARACLRYGSRELIGLIVDHANSRLDVLILSSFAPLSAVGRYVIAQYVAEIVLLLPGSLGTVLGPKIAASRSDGYSRPTLRLNGSLSLLAMLALLAAGPVFIVVGYGSAYAPAVTPFLILLPGMWFLSASALAREALRGRGQPGRSSLVASVTVVATIALDLALIPPFGVVGAAAASTAAYAVGGIASLIVVARGGGMPARTLLLATPRETWSALSTLRRRRGPR